MNKPLPANLPALMVTSERLHQHPVPWYQSLRFQGIFLLLLLGSWLVVGIVLVMNTKGRALVMTESARLIEQTGATAVGEMATRTREIAALTRAIALTVEKVPKNAETLYPLIPSLLDFNGDLDIAGGGVWPAPYQFEPARERRSFFWGREPDGTLKYYDNYNQGEIGYHNREWYAPTQYMPPGNCFWSQSYMDPYSYQPMVSCAVATRDDNLAFSGAVTIDLKLEGLQTFVDWLQAKTGGYIFVTDRNNRFITFPTPERVKHYGIDENGKRIESFMLTEELAIREPLFKPVHQSLEQMNKEIIARAESNTDYDFHGIVANITTESNEINELQGRLVAATVIDPLRIEQADTPLQSYRKIHLTDDVMLGEPADLYLFHVPGTYWKLAIVKPLSESRRVADTIVYWLMAYMMLTALLVIMISFFLLSRLLIHPVLKLTNTMDTMSELVTNERFNELGNHSTTHIGRGEIGRLATFFDTLIQQVQVQHQAVHQAREDAEEAQLAAEAASLAKSRFLANMSHELRTPLNAVIGYSEMLREDVEVIHNPDILYDLNSINRSSRHLLSLINDILDLSKIEAGQVDIYIEKCDLHQFLDGILATARPLCMQKKNVLIFDGAPNVPDVFHTDVTKLGQILLNLLGNAAKFTEGREISFSAVSHHETDGEWLRLTVADQGIGMDEEQLTKIFKPFIQADDSSTRRFGGTGLGLTITRYFVEMLGGYISVKSVLGEGSTFTVELPVRESV